MSERRGWLIPEQALWYIGIFVAGAIITGLVTFLVNQGRDAIRIEGIADIQNQVVETREKRGKMISELRDDLQAQISDLRERVANIEGELEEGE